MDTKIYKPIEIHIVDSTESSEFAHLTRSLTRSSIIALDAEWKPLRSHQSHFPTVTLLQLACQLRSDSAESNELTEFNESVVFLIDLALWPLSSIWELLRDVFESPDVLKLGFKFKQDLVYLSSTFCSQECDLGFDRVSAGFQSKFCFCRRLLVVLFN